MDKWKEEGANQELASAWLLEPELEVASSPEAKPEAGGSTGEVLELFPEEEPLGEDVPEPLADGYGASSTRVEELQGEEPDSIFEGPEVFDGGADEDDIPDDFTLLVHRTIRSGQSIYYPGNVVILGDVNPGSEVVAGGSIIVLGSCRGMAHAGANGNWRATVTAFRLQPIQLRIAHYVSRAPDDEEKGIGGGGPETARVVNGQVVIEPYGDGISRSFKLGYEQPKD